MKQKQIRSTDSCNGLPNLSDGMLWTLAVVRAVEAFGIGRGDWTMAKLCGMKSHFGVSAEAFALRLEELGLIEPALRENLRDRLRSRYKACPRSMEPPPRKPTGARARL